MKNAVSDHKLIIFYDVQISRMKKKIHRYHVQGQKPSIKCAYSERGSKLMVVRTHMEYLFPIENENVLLSKRCTHFILPSELWISFHNVAYCPILDKYENQMIRISLHTFHFLQMGAASSSELLIYSVSNTIITSKIENLYWRNEIWMRWYPMKG